jgi:hypothetical protein
MVPAVRKKIVSAFNSTTFLHIHIEESISIDLDWGRRRTPLWPVGFFFGAGAQGAAAREG